MSLYMMWGRRSESLLLLTVAVKVEGAGGVSGGGGYSTMPCVPIESTVWGGRGSNKNLRRCCCSDVKRGRVPKVGIAWSLESV